LNDIKEFCEWYNQQYVDTTKYHTMRRLKGERMVHIPSLDYINNMQYRHPDFGPLESQIIQAHAQTTARLITDDDDRAIHDIVDPREELNWGNEDWDDVLLPQWLRWCISAYEEQKNEQMGH